MTEISSVIAARFDIIVQSGAGFDYYFEFEDVDGRNVDLTGVDLKIEVRDLKGFLQTTFSLGAGITTLYNDDGLLSIMYLYKTNDSNEIAEGVYNWDLKFTAPDDSVIFPFRGHYQTVKHITA